MFDDLQTTAQAKKLLECLSDGKRHSKYSLVRDLGGDNLSSKSFLAVHLCTLRKAITPRGYDILCVYRAKRLWYQLVRLVSQDE